MSFVPVLRALSHENLLTVSGDGRRSSLLPLSFRLRLTLFFVLIVVLPIVALAVVVVQVASDSADGKADARLDAGLRAATTLYDRVSDESRAAAATRSRSDWPTTPPR